MNTLPSAPTNRTVHERVDVLKRRTRRDRVTTAEDFAQFVGARWGSLYRLAYLLAASPTGAERLLQTALETAYVNWGRIRRMEDVEACVRQMLAHTLVSSLSWGLEPRAALGRAARDRWRPHRAVGRRSLLALAAGVRTPPWSTSCDRPSLLRRPERGADRGGPRLRTWHCEVAVSGGHRCATTGIGRVGHRRAGGRVMSLDDELRAALDHQTDLRQAPPPDVQGLLSGGRARRRRRHAIRAGVGFAAVALVAGGVYGITQIDPWGTPAGSGPAATVTTLPSFQDTEFVPIKPGTYRMDVGAAANGARVEAELTVKGPGWLSGTQPVVSEVSPVEVGPIEAGVGVYQPRLLAGGSGCTGTWTGRAPGTTPLEMARQLTRLPSSEVVQRPTATRAFGHDALHLRLRIDDHCPMDEFYRLAETPSGIVASATPTSPKWSTSTCGSSTWTGRRSWSTCGITPTRRMFC